MVGATADNVDLLLQGVRDSGYEPVREDEHGVPPSAGKP
jgi:hypothetical protein